HTDRAPIISGQRRAEDVTPRRDRARDLFTRSAEGRRYQNGIALRDGGYISSGRIRHYFPYGYSYYPYYSPTFSFGLTFYSPYSYYYGSCPPYVYRRHCYYSTPSVVYVEIPVYTDYEARGYDSGFDDYYLSRNEYRYEYDSRGRDPDLDRAIDAIREAF